MKLSVIQQRKPCYVTQLALAYKEFTWKWFKGVWYLASVYYFCSTNTAAEIFPFRVITFAIIINFKQVLYRENITIRLDIASVCMYMYMCLVVCVVSLRELPSDFVSVKYLTLKCPICSVYTILDWCVKGCLCLPGVRKTVCVCVWGGGGDLAHRSSHSAWKYSQSDFKPCSLAHSLSIATLNPAH